MFKHLAVVGALLAGVLTGVTTASAPAVAAGSAGGYVSVPATRLLDTYAGVGVPHQSVPAHGTVTVRFAGRSPVPGSGAAAVTFTLSAISPTASGWLTAYPAGHTRPRAVDLAVTAHQNAATPVTIPLGSNGAVTIYNGTSGTLGLLADVTGYFRAGTATAGSYVPLAAQTRVLDTYAGVGVPKQWVAGGHTLTVPVAGHGGIPGTGAASVVLTLAATGATRSGWVTAYPAGQSRPTAVDLAVNAGHDAADLVTVPLGANGAISLYNASTGSIGLLADVLGYYRAGMPATTGSFVALPKQTRVLDTKAGVGAPKGTVYEATPLTLHLAGRAGIPASGAGAVIATLTATGVTQPGWIKAFPTDVGWPNAVSLALNRYQNSSAMVALPLSATGDVTFAPSSYAYLLLDVVGYTRAPAAPAGVTASSSGTGISLSWNAATDPGVTRYVVRRTASTTAPATMDDGALVADVPAATTAITDRNLTPGTRYSYSVFAVDAGLDASPRAIAAATTPARTMSWDAGTEIDPAQGNPEHLSCVSSAFCAAVDNFGGLFTFNGIRWSEDFRSVSVIWQSVSCASVTFCVAMGEDCPGLYCPPDISEMVSTFDGEAWTTPVSALPGAASPGRIACPQPGDCVELSTDFLAGSAEPALMTAHLTSGVEGPETSDPTALQVVTSFSCTSATDCVASDGSHLARYDGSHWSDEVVTSDSYPLSVASCAVGSTTCVVIDRQGRSVTITHSASGYVDSPPVPIGLSGAGQLSCATPSSCIAVGKGVVHLDSTGWHPVAGSLPSTDISCATSDFCAAVTDAGAAILIEHSVMGPPTMFDPPRYQPNEIACSSARACVVINATGDELSLHDGVWSKSGSLFSASDDPYPVSCAHTAATFCLAASRKDAAVFDGSTWAHVAAPPGPVLSLSCPTTSFCAAELETPSDGFAPEATAYRNGVWSPPVRLASELGPGALSCGSPTFCEIVGVNGVARFDGARWTESSAGPRQSLLSCPRSNVPVCVALQDGTNGAGPRISLFDGSRWRVVVTLPFNSQNVATGITTGLTCVSSGSCLLATADGAVYRFNGSTVSAIGAVDVPAGNDGWFGPEVECVSSTTCFAIADAHRYGLAYRYS